ncbi:flagellar basal body P-ring formation chaperone FlgA [Microbulbifer aggregans]|uniref:flagellar basal body P-ring formation chaperone FlgA n=1 Tax=Microbulbifer aggregans TaxID=1769779 RepID=UPI001CFEFA79|nr:flagellar basal body P-ring formation chaperone FlgA [Microbulbifer aggregans]
MLRLFLSTTLLALTVSAHAANNSQAAANAARQFLQQQSRHLGERVEIDVQSTAHWPRCENPQPFLPPNRQLQWGRVTLGIRCGDSPRPRYLQAQVRVFGHYWVTKEKVAVGTEITSALLRRVEGEISALPRGTLQSRAEIVGQVASRPLRAGSTLQEHQLKSRPMVNRRQTVDLVASGRGFRIVREGRALDEGGFGDQVRVRLPDRQIIYGRISAPGEVSVTGNSGT